MNTRYLMRCGVYCMCRGGCEGGSNVCMDFDLLCPFVHDSHFLPYPVVFFTILYLMPKALAKVTPPLSQWTGHLQLPRCPCPATGYSSASSRLLAEETLYRSKYLHFPIIEATKLSTSSPRKNNLNIHIFRAPCPPSEVPPLYHHFTTSIPHR